MELKPYKRLALICGTIGALLLFWAGIRYGQDRLTQIDTVFTPEITTSSVPEAASAPESASETATVPATAPVPTIMVHAVGAVQNPGVYILEQGARIKDLIALAQPSDEADLSQVNLAGFLEDASQIRIPKHGEKAQILNDPAHTSTERISNGKSLVNINQATQKELETLPGIGPAYAARIIAYRDDKGRFAKVEDLTKVSGIGTATLEKLKPYITVD